MTRMIAFPSLVAFTRRILADQCPPANLTAPGRRRRLRMQFCWIHALFLEAHLGYEWTPSWIIVEQAHSGAVLDRGESRIPLRIRPLQPREGRVRLPADREDLRDRIGRNIRVLIDQLSECPIRFRATPGNMLDDRQ